MTYTVGAIASSTARLLQIPVLTAKAIQTCALPPNTLVRYVGLVQDVLDYELYPAVYGELDAASGAFQQLRVVLRRGLRQLQNIAHCHAARCLFAGTVKMRPRAFRDQRADGAEGRFSDQLEKR